MPEGGWKWMRTKIQCDRPGCEYKSKTPMQIDRHIIEDHKETKLCSTVSLLPKLLFDL